MASPPAAVIMVPQWTVNTKPQPMFFPTSRIEESYKILNKGQPKALGTTQLVLTLLHISLGTLGTFFLYSEFSISTYSAICFWGALFYIISGSLSIAVENNPYHSLINGFQAMNILSSVVSLFALAIFIIDAYFTGPMIISYDYYDYITNDDIYSNYSSHPSYAIYSYRSNGFRISVLTFLIISTVLQFCVCVSLSIVGCKYASHRSNARAQVFVVPNNHPSSAVIINPNPYKVSPSNGV
uniref:Uncharacterized protein n=1 Tax=Leptobrachium leishanense TaxID=445787 RepID=A0A8C5QMY9_9ANUR